MAAPPLRNRAPAGRAPWRRAAGFRDVLGARLHRRYGGDEALRLSLRLCSRSARQEAQDSVRQDRDLLREDRFLWLRRLPRPSGLVRARRMARVAASRSQAALDLQPADHAIAWAARQWPGQPRL